MKKRTIVFVSYQQLDLLKRMIGCLNRLPSEINGICNGCTELSVSDCGNVKNEAWQTNVIKETWKQATGNYILTLTNDDSGRLFPFMQKQADSSEYDVRRSKERPYAFHRSLLKLMMQQNACGSMLTVNQYKGNRLKRIEESKW